MPESKRVKLEDDTKESVSLLVERRVPWLVIGLVAGMGLPFISSRFENLLSANISLVFFIPIIVYLSDAVGTQSQTIFVRNLVHKNMRFSNYLIKEFLVGTLLGLIFGSVLCISAYIWLKSAQIAVTVGLAMFLNISLAPLLAILMSKFLQKEKTDPALGSGPFSTVLQDLISLTIYFLVAWVIIL